MCAAHSPDEVDMVFLVLLEGESLRAAFDSAERIPDRQSNVCASSLSFSIELIDSKETLRCILLGRVPVEVGIRYRYHGYVSSY